MTHKEKNLMSGLRLTLKKNELNNRIKSDSKLTSSHGSLTAVMTYYNLSTYNRPSSVISVNQ